MILPDAFKARELRLGVDPLDFKAAARTGRIDAHAVAHRQTDDVGEVVLALGVGGFQFREPPGKARRRQQHDDGVDFADLLLAFGGVFLLDDRHNAALLAQDAAVAGRIAQNGRQNRHAVACGRQKPADRLGLHERHVAQKHERVFGGRIEFGQRALQSVAGAELRLLQRKAQAAFAGKGPLDGFGAAAHDDHGARDVSELFDGAQNVSEHGTARQRLKHLGQGRVHALALSCGKNDDVDHENSFFGKYALFLQSSRFRAGW